jgi:hypothetical protein
MVERVNGTIKNATVKAIMYQNIDEMKQDLNKFLIFYNFNRGHGAFMNILNYKLDTTNELLTSRIGLITLAHTIQVLDLSKTIDGETVFWLKSLYQLGFVRFFGFYFWIGEL